MKPKRNIDEKAWCIYMHRNKIDNKVYIGQTQNYKKRCTPGNYYGCTYFYNAIQEYGWDNFDHIILEDNLTQEEANEKEIYYIKYYDSTNHDLGYNLSNGGAFQRCYFGENNSFYGKHHSEKTKEILRQKNKGGNNPHAKPVRCLNTGRVFPSCREASNWCGIPSQNIQRCCKGGRPTAGKHPETQEKLKWRYIEDEI